MDRLAVSVAEAAQIIGLSRSRLYELVAEGEVDARKLGSRTVVTVASLERLLDSAPKCEVSYTNAKARAA